MAAGAEPELYGGPTSGGGDHVEPGPDLAGAPPHVAQAHAGGRVGGIEAAAVVPDAKEEQITHPPGFQVHVARPRVLGDVPEGLDDYPVDRSQLQGAEGF